MFVCLSGYIYAARYTLWLYICSSLYTVRFQLFSATQISPGASPSVIIDMGKFHVKCEIIYIIKRVVFLYQSVLHNPSGV